MALNTIILTPSILFCFLISYGKIFVFCCIYVCPIVIFNISTYSATVVHNFTTFWTMVLSENIEGPPGRNASPTVHVTTIFLPLLFVVLSRLSKCFVWSGIFIVTKTALYLIRLFKRYSVLIHGNAKSSKISNIYTYTNKENTEKIVLFINNNIIFMCICC